MTPQRKVILLENDIFSKRLFLRALKELNCEIVTFDSFDKLTAYNDKQVNGVILSLNDVRSPKEAAEFFDKMRKKNPRIFTCVVADGHARNFPCAFVRPLQYSFIERKLTVEFYKYETRKTKSYFDFVGVAIASSTGGPITLQHFFANLPYTEQAAFFIVLHAPDWMLETYAQRLDAASVYSVKLAQNGMHIKPGNVYVAPGDFHMKINKTAKTILLTKDEPYNFLRPAADPLFFSVAEAFGEKSLGIIFTGMGKDGSLGAGKIHAAGGKIIVQSPDTAVIHSMPQAVIELGIADKVVSLEKLSRETIKTIRKILGK